jgi:hypothetical protein
LGYKELRRVGCESISPRYLIITRIRDNKTHELRGLC